MSELNITNVFKTVSSRKQFYSQGRIKTKELGSLDVVIELLRNRLLTENDYIKIQMCLTVAKNVEDICRRGIVLFYEGTRFDVDYENVIAYFPLTELILYDNKDEFDLVYEGFGPFSQTNSTILKISDGQIRTII